MSDLANKVLQFRRMLELTLPELGPDKFTIRGLNIMERGRLIAATREAHDKKEMVPLNALMVALFLGDAEGNRIFSDDQLETLKTWDSTLAETIALKGLTLNGLRDDAQEKKT